MTQWRPPTTGTEPVDDTASLGDGALVRAHVLARLLGIRLLRIEADIVLAPIGRVDLPMSDDVRLTDARRMLTRAEQLLASRAAR